jgi:hypothetical protein
MQSILGQPSNESISTKEPNLAHADELVGRRKLARKWLRCALVPHADDQRDRLHHLYRFARERYGHSVVYNWAVIVPADLRAYAFWGTEYLVLKVNVARWVFLRPWHAANVSDVKNMQTGEKGSHSKRLAASE